jgi:Leucine-rich repeat (LRR) protein
MSSDDVCCVCLEELGTITAKLKCNHTLHTECLLKLNTTDKKCPLCRRLYMDNPINSPNTPVIFTRANTNNGPEQISSASLTGFLYRRNNDMITTTNSTTTMTTNTTNYDNYDLGNLFVENTAVSHDDGFPPYNPDDFTDADDFTDSTDIADDPENITHIPTIIEQINPYQGIKKQISCNILDIRNLNITDLKLYLNMYTNTEKERIKKLYINNNFVDSLFGVEKLKNLESLFAPYNNISILSPINIELNKLQVFDCSHNHIKNFQNFYIPNIKNLTCNNNLIDELNIQVINLEELNFNNNLILSIYVTFPRLKKLECENNKIAFVNINAQNLEHLYCDNNLITALTLNTRSLRGLCIKNNKISNLNGITAPILRVLSCENNLISDYNLNIFKSEHPKMTLFISV